MIFSWGKRKKIHFLLLILRDKVSKQDPGVQNKKHVFRYLTLPHKSPIKRALTRGCSAGCSTHMGVCNTHISHKTFLIRNECSGTYSLKPNPGSNTPCDSCAQNMSCLPFPFTGLLTDTRLKNKETNMTKYISQHSVIQNNLREVPVAKYSVTGRCLLCENFTPI